MTGGNSLCSRSSSTLSSCGKRLILSVPQHCKIQKLSSSSPSFGFYSVPPHLDVSSMGGNRVIGRNLRGDIIAWDGGSGGVIFLHDNRDFGEYYLPTLAITQMPCSLKEGPFSKVAVCIIIHYSS